MQLSTQNIRTPGGTLSFRELLKLCLDEVCSMMKWPAGHVYLLASPSGVVLLPTSIWYLDNPKHFEMFRQVSNALRFAKGVGLPGQVFATKEPAWITDVSKSGTMERARLLNDSGLCSAFAYPVVHKKEVVAVLEFFSDRPIEPDSRILEFLAKASFELSLAFAAEEKH